MAYNATDHHTRVMFDALVKQGSDSPGDDDESTVGVNPDQQPDPEDRPKGDMDAPWGEETSPGKKNEPEQFSDAAMQGFINSRQEMLDSLFDSKGPAQKAEASLVGQQLAHGASGNFETKAPLLERKTAEDQTLSELVRGILE